MEDEGAQLVAYLCVVEVVAAGEEGHDALEPVVERLGFDAVDESSFGYRARVEIPERSSGDAVHGRVGGGEDPVEAGAVHALGEITEFGVVAAEFESGGNSIEQRVREVAVALVGLFGQFDPEFLEALEDGELDEFVSTGDEPVEVGAGEGDAPGDVVHPGRFDAVFSEAFAGGRDNPRDGLLAGADRGESGAEGHDDRLYVHQLPRSVHRYLFLLTISLLRVRLVLMDHEEHENQGVQ